MTKKSLDSSLCSPHTALSGKDQHAPRQSTHPLSLKDLLLGRVQAVRHSSHHHRTPLDLFNEADGQSLDS